MKLYLAHPLGTRFYVRDYLEPAIQLHGHQTTNPFKDRPGGEVVYQNIPLESIVKTELAHTKPTTLVNTEKNMIEQADGLLAYLPYPSIGTSMEILYNHTLLGRGREHTLVWAPNKEILIHPWITSHATVRANLGELMRLLEESPSAE